MKLIIENKTDFSVDVDDLLRAFNRLRKKVPDWHFYRIAAIGVTIDGNKLVCQLEKFDDEINVSIITP